MKAVTLYRPKTLENALSDFDRYVDSFFGDNFLAPSQRVFGRISGSQCFPAVDVWETEKAYVLEAELPGFDEKDIEVRLDGNTLTIESKKIDERHAPDQNAGGAGEGDSAESVPAKTSAVNYLIRERALSAFSRSFKLPQNADSEGIAASFKNGILSMEVAKKPEAQKRVIQVLKS
ncbi:MAG: Hsp20/alpha crystallin family protein [Treponema sp.]|nr:Hsp20/alpha crystallin family protein [Treponema sp.]